MIFSPVVRFSPVDERGAEFSMGRKGPFFGVSRRVEGFPPDGTYFAYGEYGLRRRDHEEEVENPQACEAFR